MTGGAATDVSGAAGGVVVVAVCPMVMLPSWMKVAPVAGGVGMAWARRPGVHDADPFVQSQNDALKTAAVS